jgi:glycosyltransferase involved in cell wall biosynthesis
VSINLWISKVLIDINKVSSHLLAIIIPAYKEEFLESALESLSLQTNKNFTLYIGDDNSPYELFPIVSKFTSEIDIVYKKFDENIGGVDLIKQWERCIDLINEESYVWLFSDDDLMDANCVDAFYNELITSEIKFDVYRFNTEIINSVGEVIFKNAHFSNPELSYNFLTKKLNREIESFVTEYIFSTKIYEETGRFVSFPLAWASDDATWTKFSFKKGICTIADGKVYWRMSDSNISNTSNANGAIKCFALIQFAEWGIKFFRDEEKDAELRTNFFKFIFDQYSGYKVRITLPFIWKIAIRLKKVLGVDYTFSFTFFLKKKLRQLRAGFFF